MADADAEREALWMLEQLVVRHGAQFVLDVLEIVTTGGPGMLVKDVSTLVGGVVREILDYVEADAARAAIAAGFAAANAAGDAALDAKFPKGGG